MNQDITYDEIMYDSNEMKYKIHLLGTIETIQQQTGKEGIQPKYIVKVLKKKISHQTVYMTLNTLVKENYLNKWEKGKFSFYSMTEKGTNLMTDFKKFREKVVTGPFVTNLANKLLEEHPEEFKNTEFGSIVNYLNNQIKKFEMTTTNSAIEHFLKSANDDEKIDVT